MSFATLFASVLRLSGVKPPVLKRDCVETTVRRLALDGEPFERIFALTDKGAQTLSGTGANELFGTHLAQIERVIEAVDRTT